jgi:hypothetical protein
MRILIASQVAIAMALAASAQAQTYDPDYPVCLQTFGRDGNSISCGFTSMVQCKWSASARAAQCIVNPYFAAKKPGRARPQRQ